VRRELLDHVIPLNEYHLRWLGHAYVAYYHADQTHIALNKSTPAQSVVECRSGVEAISSVNHDWAVSIGPSVDLSSGFPSCGSLSGYDSSQVQF
jgi:hypothetical protein